MKKLIAVAAMLMFSLNALALDLGSAKAQGLVGEQRDGLLGVVKTPASAEVKSLVASINKKRKAKFAATAGKTGGTVAQVAARFATLAQQKTAAGHYVQDSSGKWVKK